MLKKDRLNTQLDALKLQIQALQRSNAKDKMKAGFETTILELRRKRDDGV